MLTSLVLALFFAASISAADDDWPCWRGSERDALTPGPWAVEGETVWTAEIGLGYSCPSVRAGRVYTLGFDVERELDVLRCLDLATGKELWRHEYAGQRRDFQHEGGTLTTPAVDGGRVYVTSREGFLRCLDAGDGRVIWVKNLAYLFEVDPQYYGFAGSPVVVDDLVVVAADRALALDKGYGDLVWRTEPLDTRFSTPQPIELDGTPHVAVFGQRGVDVFVLADGERRTFFPWRKSPRLVNASTPVVVGERLFVSSAYEHGCALVELPPGDEAPAVWSNRRMRNKMAGCVLVDDHLYGFDESLLKCLDLEGEERWRVRGLGNGSLIGGDGKLLILSSRGELIVAEATPEEFRELSRTELLDEGVFWTPPVVAGGRVLVRNNRGTLVCRDHRVDRAATASAPLASAGTAEVAAGTLPTPAALFARHVELLGGADTVRRRTGLRLAGTFEMRSQGFVLVPFEVEWLAPDSKRVRIKAPPPMEFWIERVFDGEVAYELNPRLGDKLLDDDLARELRAASDLHAGLAPDERYTSLETAGVETFAGRPCYRVDAVVAADGSERRLFFDVEAGWLAGRAGEGEAIAIYADYRDLDGHVLPTLEHYFVPGTGVEEVFRVESAASAEVDPARFERPDPVERLLAEREDADD